MGAGRGRFWRAARPQDGWPGSRSGRRLDRTRRLPEVDDHCLGSLRGARRRRGDETLASVESERGRDRALPRAIRHRHGLEGQCHTPTAGPGERCDPRGRRRGRRHQGGRRRGRDRSRRQGPASRLVDRRRRGMDPNRVGPPGSGYPARGDPGAGRLHGGGRSGVVPPLPFPDLDLDGRALVLRFPDIRGAGGQDRLGSMRDRDRPREQEFRASGRRHRGCQGFRGPAPPASSRTGPAGQDVSLHAHARSRFPPRQGAGDRATSSRW